jgi:tetratricopeptide (TPR) repeat protein
MKKNIITYIAAVFLISGCNSDFSDVVDFKQVTNPNLSEGSVVGLPNSSALWKSGIEREISRTLNEILILAELGSDNYVNIQTYFSQFMDNMDIRTTDPDIRDTQNEIARVMRMAEYGIATVGPNDPDYSAVTEAEFNFYLGYARLLAGMYFSKLPQETLGVPVTSDDLYANAITSFNAAISLNPSAEYHLAKARANYYLGKKSEAVAAATAAISADDDFLRSAEYDELEGPSNTMEDALYERGTFDDFQPLPSLDFLDPKYSFVDANVDPSVHYLKAEEAYLILAEAHLSDGNVAAAQQNLTSLLALVATRDVREVDESGETRGNQSNAVDDSTRPSSSEVTVNGRSGLILDRDNGDVSIPSVSGTSLTASEIAAMGADDAGLALIYRTRQEIFIAEGIRFVDMGIKLVINENEILQNENISDGDAGTVAVVPSFIDAVKNDLDGITFDAANNSAATTVDVTAILIQNKTSSSVVPFE